MSKLEFANRFFFQLFFVRLAKTVDTLPDGTFVWYSLMGFIVPFTGWDNDYEILGELWFFRICSVKR